MLKGLSDLHRRRFGRRGAQNDVVVQEAVVVQGGKNAGQCPELEDVKSEQRYLDTSTNIHQKQDILVSRVIELWSFCWVSRMRTKNTSAGWRRAGRFGGEGPWNPSRARLTDEGQKTHLSHLRHIWMFQLEIGGNRFSGGKLEKADPPMTWGWDDEG
ncbi:hypothetical protein B0H13DRAFT_1866693 [Mycena leptocephala]|nr:hypothetical protein B0H13DRAFT_1866693 [Mycena leptocephala]